MGINGNGRKSAGVIDWKMDRKVLLSTLWLFAILNYLYCDVLALMDADLLGQFLAGTVEGVQITQEFLLGASILMEIPISMVLLSRTLNHKANRWANIIAGITMTVVQIATVLGPVTAYYMFFSIIEIATTLVIFLVALKWKGPEGISS